jgi:hypothetical protein
VLQASAKRETALCDGNVMAAPSAKVFAGVTLETISHLIGGQL